MRFGIIDFVQQYTLDKVFEGQFKKIINRGEVPTIVDPEKYKYRFKRAMKRYFIGLVTQEEKANELKREHHYEQEQTIIEERSDEEDELNQTTTNIKDRLNETLGNIGGTTQRLQNPSDGTSSAAHDHNANLIMSPNF